VKPKLAQTDIAVVGGGMAGMTAACYPAREGVEVTLFEQRLSWRRCHSEDQRLPIQPRHIRLVYRRRGITGAGEAKYDLRSLQHEGLFMLQGGELHSLPVSLVPIKQLLGVS
jgi:2-polyprenyl-6-methoxyphenol hydroxylase-like FAD-dependent oxidoreductase